MNAIGNKIYVMDPIFGRGAAVARIPKMRKERGEREREKRGSLISPSMVSRSRSFAKKYTGGG